MSTIKSQWSVPRMWAGRHSNYALSIKHYALTFLSLIALSSSAWAGKIYVSPQGNDNASGNRKHPLRTLEGALQKVRQLRAEKPLNDTVFIQLTEGTWQLSSPLTLNPEDSGTPQSPLVIQGEGMSKSVLSGGMAVQGFQDAGNGLWQLDLSKVMVYGGDVPQVSVEGRRAICARTPNELEFFPTGPADEHMIDKGNGITYVSVKVPEEAIQVLKKVAPHPTNLRINFLHAWDITRRYVQSFSAADSAVFFTGKVMPSWNRIDRVAQFYLENDRSFLDAPGEYFYDKEKRMLYYMPRQGETMTSATAVIPAQSQLLIVKGTEDANVENIIFRNLTLGNARYDYPWKGDEPHQASAHMGAAIDLNYARNIQFLGCEMVGIASWGMSLGTACQYNTVRGCYLHDLGCGGIRIGTTNQPKNEDKELSRHNVIDNNILRSGSRVFATGVGVILFNTSDNEVTHNDISDFYYTGISAGWVWGYSHSPSQRNTITYNHIHHIGWGVLSDMGGIYTLGDSHGTQVSNNHIHDIYSLGYGGWGLYTDEGTTGIRMENNLVYRCKSSGFHQHYGKDNIISNNIFVNNLVHQLEATRTEPDHLPFTFSHNIILYEQGTMWGINWGSVNFKADENLYWNTKGDVTWNGVSHEEWTKETGKDAHSVIADPQFRDVEGGDFTIGNQAAIDKIHFKPFDYSQAGVYGNEDWIKLAQPDPAMHTRYQAIVDRLMKLPQP